MLTATNYKYRNFTTSKVACFISVDPKYHKYPQMSSYTAMGNNPVTNIDPDGQEFTPAMQDWINRYREKMSSIKIKQTNKITELEDLIIKETNGQNRKSKIEDYKSELKEAQTDRDSYKAEFKQIEFEITTLKKSNQTYDIKEVRSIQGNDAIQGQTIYENENIVMELPYLEGSYSGLKQYSADIKYFAHELKHMFQFEMGKLDIRYVEDGKYLKSPGDFLYSLQDEYEAYDRQGFFGDTDTNSTIKSNKADLKENDNSSCVKSLELYYDIYIKNTKNSKEGNKIYDMLVQDMVNSSNTVIRQNNKTYVPNN